MTEEDKKRQTHLFDPSAGVAPPRNVPSEEVVFIRTESAVAMYLRGQLVYDSSFITREIVLDKLGIKHSTHEADELWWSSQAGALFPAQLSECKIANQE